MWDAGKAQREADAALAAAAKKKKEDDDTAFAAAAAEAERKEKEEQRARWGNDEDGWRRALQHRGEWNADAKGFGPDGKRARFG
jgi:hypothetical protein